MPPSPLFPLTRWTLLAEATLDGDAGGRAALERLCENYRPPVVAFLRNRGWSPEEAEDLTQDLFAKLLASRAWKQADRAKGRFRNFLLTILRRLVASHVVHTKTQKNGGGWTAVSLEWLNEETGWEPADEEAAEPSVEFDRTWAARMLRVACARVESRWREGGREQEFAVYRRFLPGSQLPPGYAEVTAALGNSESAARSAVCRLRQELAEALRQEVSLTVNSPHEIDEEMAYLHSVLARPERDRPV